MSDFLSEISGSMDAVPPSRKPMIWTPYEMTNPRGHQRGPFSLRYAAGRAEGMYATVADAILFANVAARGKCSVVTSEGWWIVGRLTPDEELEPCARAVLAAPGKDTP